MSLSTTILGREHRALASVGKGLMFLFQDIQSRGQAPGFPLLNSIGSYIKQSPDKLRHLKEEKCVTTKNWGPFK
jgi:hypothetical protein